MVVKERWPAQKNTNHSAVTFKRILYMLLSHKVHSHVTPVFAFIFYRPQHSCGKVIFSQASVILFGGGGCVAGGVRGRRQERRPLQRTVRILLECILVILVVPFMKMQMLTVLFTKPLAEPFQALTGTIHVEWKKSLKLWMGEPFMPEADNPATWWIAV